MELNIDTNRVVMAMTSVLWIKSGSKATLILFYFFNDNDQISTKFQFVPKVAQLKALL